MDGAVGYRLLTRPLLTALRILKDSASCKKVQRKEDDDNEARVHLTGVRNRNRSSPNNPTTKASVLIFLTIAGGRPLSRSGQLNSLMWLLQICMWHCGGPAQDQHIIRVSASD